jgi:DNA-binding SARP family transcriptional activator
LLAQGDPAAALSQYRELERRLQEELGEEPVPATRQLLRQIEQNGKIEQQQSRQEAPAVSSPVSVTTDPPSSPGTMSRRAGSLRAARSRSC